MKQLTDQEAWRELFLANRSTCEVDNFNKRWRTYIRANEQDPKHNWTPVTFVWCLLLGGKPDGSLMPVLQCCVTTLTKSEAYRIYNDVDGRYRIVLEQKQYYTHAETIETASSVL